MYGREYLDWRDRERVAGLIDGFLAGLEPEDRVWALSVLRERHTVYKDGSDPRNQFALLAQSMLPSQSALQRQAQHPNIGHIGSTGNSILSGLFG